MAAITREAIETRLAELRRDAEQMRANLHAYDGAIQDCEHWLAVLDAPETTDEPTQ